MNNGPNPCPWEGCGRVFDRQCDLNKHYATHTRLFKCPIESCIYHQEGFATEKDKDRHHREQHTEAERFQCLRCGHTSSRQDNLNKHMEKMHQIPYIRTKGKNAHKNESKSTGSASQALPASGHPPASAEPPVPEASPESKATPEPEATHDLQWHQSPESNDSLGPLTVSSPGLTWGGSTEDSGRIPALRTPHDPFLAPECEDTFESEAADTVDSGSGSPYQVESGDLVEQWLMGLAAPLFDDADGGCPIFEEAMFPDL